MSSSSTNGRPGRSGNSAASTGASLAEPSNFSGPVPVAVPTSRRRARGNDDDDDVEIDAAEFEALSKSLTTGGNFLQPESFENSMLRPPALNPNPRRDDEEAVDGSSLDDDCDPDEESPLLRRSRAPSKARSEASAATVVVTPYLNDISVTRFWFIFSQILTLYFIGAFDGTIMASSHPVITSYFHASNSASWLSTAFLLTSSAFQPLLGRLSDAIGRKPLFVGSLGVFALATTWCALAGSIKSFILARAACGIGAGGVMTLGSIIISDLVPIE